MRERTPAGWLIRCLSVGVVLGPALFELQWFRDASALSGFFFVVA